MLKRVWVYVAILLGIVFVFVGHFWFESWKFRQETLEELGPFLADEQEQKTELLAFGKVDLNPSDLTLATLEQKLKSPALKRPGDFNSTRLGWGCGKERCATFLVPIIQDIPSNAAPAGLTIKSPAPDDFPNISIREFHLGESDKKLVELSKGSVGARSRTLFHRFSWDKDWTAAWASLDGKVFEFVFANETLQRRLTNAPQSAGPTPTK